MLKTQRPTRFASASQYSPSVNCCIKMRTLFAKRWSFGNPARRRLVAVDSSLRPRPDFLYLPTNWGKLLALSSRQHTLGDTRTCAQFCRHRQTQTCQGSQGSMILSLHIPWCELLAFRPVSRSPCAKHRSWNLKVIVNFRSSQLKGFL